MSTCAHDFDRDGDIDNVGDGDGDGDRDGGGDGDGGVKKHKKTLPKCFVRCVFASWQFLIPSRGWGGGGGPFWDYLGTIWGPFWVHFI